MEIERVAFEQCSQQGNRRFLCVALIYMAMIASTQGDLKEAENLARSAVTAAEDMPPLRAYAMAMLGDVMIRTKQHKGALDWAREAFQILGSLKGMQEGEMLVRVTYVLALRGKNNADERRRELAEAERRLMDRASRIKDPAWRSRFLDNVPENARLLRILHRSSL